MGVRDLVPTLADGDTDSPRDDAVHHECRDCGRNLTADTDECPGCGGSVATYRLE